MYSKFVPPRQVKLFFKFGQIINNFLVFSIVLLVHILNQKMDLSKTNGNAFAIGK